MPTFEIPDGPTTVDASRSGAKPAETSATYSVTNTSPDAVDGRLGVRVSGASKDEWFAVDGNRERTFAANETQTATIRVTFPSNVPEGDYPFRLRVVAVNDPDNDHVEGPMTTAKLGPGGGGKKSLLWLWILLAVLAVAVIGGGAYYALSRPDKDTTPPPPAALTDAEALRLAEKKTAAWWAASARKDVDALVKLSPAPFYFDDGVLLDEAQVRARYNGIREDRRVARPVEEPSAVEISPNEAESMRGMTDDAQAPEFKIDKMMSYTIANLRREHPDWLQGDRVMGALKLGENDIAVMVMMRGEGTIFFFRRSPKDVEMVGFWN